MGRRAAQVRLKSVFCTLQFPRKQLTLNAQGTMRRLRPLRFWPRWYPAVRTGAGGREGGEGSWRSTDGEEKKQNCLNYAVCGKYTVAQKGSSII